MPRKDAKQPELSSLNAPRPPPPTPYPMPYPTPNYPPNYYPAQSYLPPRLPTEQVDKLMPTVPLFYRPMALKAAIWLIIAGSVLCWIFVVISLIISIYSIFGLIVFGIFLTVGIFGIISVILLMIPKRIGWYLGLVTASLGILGIGPGTIIAIFAIVALVWPSTQYFFRTGQPMPMFMGMPPMPPPMAPYPPHPYPTDHNTNQYYNHIPPKTASSIEERSENSQRVQRKSRSKK